MMKKLKKYLVISLLLFVSISIITNLYIISSTKSQIKTLDKLEKSQVILILWAWVRWNKLSDVAKDRADTAIEAYNKWLWEKILISWDNWQKRYDEVNAFKTYLLSTKIPEEDIFMDHAWFSTYDTFYRARSIFLVQSAIVVTQDFHLSRSLFLANIFWIKSQWLRADKHSYMKSDYYNLREFAARFKEFFKAAIFKPKPKYLWDKIDISWDWRITQD